jgi:diguanylate cyclase (GGDEF)-like protein/PAS domain S-box-containing protein
MLRAQRVSIFEAANLTIGTSIMSTATRDSAAAHIAQVLIADDESINRTILSHILTRSGYQVTAVANGQEALDAAEAQSFDLIMLDLVMPEMNGMDCLIAIRNKPHLADLPVIMVTADKDQHTVVEAFQLGANDYVTKPIAPEIMLARIGTHLKLHRAGCELRKSEERYSLASRGANVGLFDWDIPQSYIYLSPRWKGLLGYADEEMGSQIEEWITRIHPQDLHIFNAILSDERLQGKDRVECELRMQHRDGRYLWMQCTGVVLRDENNETIRFAGSLADITKGKVRDPLTNLPNRLYFEDRLRDALLRSQRYPNEMLAVLFVDLDNFKLINDSLGHQMGDVCLFSVAQRLESCIRATDTMSRVDFECLVARQGGDEFAILLERLGSPEEASLIAGRISSALAQPLALGSHTVSAGGSIGIAIGERGSKSAEDLLREADTAMYAAKIAGRGGYKIFDPAMQAQATLRLALENDLRDAIKKQQFTVKYQPIIRLNTNCIEGFEALVRWEHPRDELIGPAVFIPIAEEIGLIRELGKQVFRAACQQSALWRKIMPNSTPLTININCSIKELQHPNFLAEVKFALNEAQCDPRLIKIEVTESTLMADPQAVCDLLTKLREIGVRVGIDDFGTGYSSLAYLHRLPIDVLKIDRSFIVGMTSSDESIEIVRTILLLAKSLNLDVVAEGVETNEQRSLLLDMGCTHAQGYLFSKPLSVGDADIVLDRAYEQSRASRMAPVSPLPNCVATYDALLTI